MARSTAHSIAGSASLAVAEQGVLRQLHVGEFDVAGASAAEARIVGDRKARRRCRHQKQADPPRWSLMIMQMRGDDDLVGGMAVEHGDLAAGETPALRRLVG